MSELHLDGQVQTFFATFAAASDQLDLERLAELFAAAGITRVALADLQHQPLDNTYVLPEPTGAPNAQVLRARSGCPPRPSCAGRRTGCGWCSTSTTRTWRGSSAWREVTP
jgi:hypothetical protein